MSSIRKDGRGKRAAARQAEVSETPLVKRLALERKDPYACFKEPVCTRAKHPRGKGNCANNPNCVFGLGEGKDGVWAKTPAAVSQLLQHPPVRLRGGWKRAARANAALQNDNVAVASDSDEDDALPGLSVQPAGLNNLGATCYLNTLLQTLFHCLPFRRAVYAFPESSAPPSPSSSGGTVSKSGGKAYSARTVLSNDSISSSTSSSTSSSSGKEGSPLESSPGTPVVRELQKLFAHLDHEGAGQWGDTSQLVKLLGFDPSYQQDPIECWKLLGATIEEAFKATGDPCLVDLFHKEFRGKQKYITCCGACGCASEREEALEELQLQIKGRDTVADCLAHYQAPELLTGECQYYCDACNGKRDATRRIVLTKVPRVLFVQLMRYEYNKVTWDKEKLKTLVAVNESLNLDAILTSDNQSEPAALAAAVDESSSSENNSKTARGPTSNRDTGGTNSAAASSGSGGGSVKARSRARKKAAAAAPPPPEATPVAPAVVSGPSAVADFAIVGAYDLVAVVEHRGVGAHHGHYVGRMRSWLAKRDAQRGEKGRGASSAKSEAGNEGKEKLLLQAAGKSEEAAPLAEGDAANGWWLFDDTVVSKVELPAVLNKPEGADRGGGAGSSSSSSSSSFSSPFTAAIVSTSTSSSSLVSTEVVDVVESDSENETAIETKRNSSGSGGGGSGDKRRAEGYGFQAKGAKQPRSGISVPMDFLNKPSGSSNKNNNKKGKGKSKGKADVSLVTALDADATTATSSAGAPTKKDVQAERLKAAKPSSDSYVLVYAARGLLEELQAEVASQRKAVAPPQELSKPAAAFAAPSSSFAYLHGPPPSAQAAARTRTSSLQSELAAHAKVVAEQRALVVARREAYFKAFGGGGLQENDIISGKKSGAAMVNINDQLPPCVPVSSSANDFVLVPTSWLKHWITGVPPSATATNAAVADSASSGSIENSGAASASAVLIDDDNDDNAAVASTDGGSSSVSNNSPAAGSISSISSSSRLTSSNVFCELPPPADDIFCPHGTGGVSPATARTLKRLSRSALVDMLHWVKVPPKLNNALSPSSIGSSDKNSTSQDDKSLQQQQQQQQQSAKDAVNSLVASRADAPFRFYCSECTQDHQVACEAEALGASLRDRVLDGFSAADRQVAATRKQTFIDDNSWGGGKNSGPGGEPPMYLVSKVWATSFKQQCERLDAGKETTATTSLLPMMKSNNSTTPSTTALTSETPEKMLVAPSVESSGNSSSSSLDNPTAPILCSHGELKPGGAGSQVRPITQDGWEAVLALCPSATSVPFEMPKCELCGAAKESDREQKKALESARKSHVEAGTTLRALHRRADNYEPRHFETLEAEQECGGSWRVFRKAWLLKWRSWVDGSWQHEDAANRPPDLESPQDLATLLACPCGKGVLLTKQLEAVANRCAVLGSVPPGYGADAASHGHLVGLHGEGCQELELVSLAEYRELRARCQPSDANSEEDDDNDDVMSEESDDDDGKDKDDDANGEGGELVLRLGRSANRGRSAGGKSSSSSEGAKGRREKHRQGALRLAATGDGTLEWRGLVLPCVECIAKVRSEADARRASFSNASLKIHRLREGAPIPAAPAAAPNAKALGGGSGSGAAEPRPRRTARSAANAAMPVTGVGSFDRVGLLKLKVWQVLGDLEPQQMALYHHGNELTNDDATLASYDVKANDIVHCRPLTGSSSGGGNRRRSKIVVDGSDDDDENGSSDKNAVQEIKKTLEDYFLYWGSERPESGQPAEKGFSNTLLNRRSPTPTTTTLPGVAAEDGPFEGRNGGSGEGAPMAIDISEDDVTSKDGAALPENDESADTCKACTFINQLGSVTCGMCGSELKI